RAGASAPSLGFAAAVRRHLGRGRGRRNPGSAIPYLTRVTNEAIPIEAQPPEDDRFATALRGFGPLGIVAILLILLTGNVILGNMVVLPIGALLVLVWVRLSRTPWPEIGYGRPRSWIATVAIGLAFGSAFKIVMKTIV